MHCGFSFALNSNLGTRVSRTLAKPRLRNKISLQFLSLILFRCAIIFRRAFAYLQPLLRCFGAQSIKKQAPNLMNKLCLQLRRASAQFQCAACDCARKFESRLAARSVFGCLADSRASNWSPQIKNSKTRKQSAKRRKNANCNSRKDASFCCSQFNYLLLRKSSEFVIS